ncbi:MAG: class I SAM-dependent rRNA methyltransferase, partial [Deltaproteobacteria bacterium]|nr:class I SAM-dependent rRNA methyltransferase [Deltaproteobacteria bacterium]
QRENRRLLAKYVRGSRVLNTFCYSGGFSVSAASGGASSVHSIDASEAALELCRENIALNPSAAEHVVTRGECMKLLNELDARYDVVVLDPPAFAKRRESVDGALRGYENLNVMGLRLFEGDGILFTFSCSQMVTRDDFRKAIQIAAARAGKRVQVLHELHQAPCHPVSIFHPEGEYLKGFVLAVSSR